MQGDGEKQRERESGTIPFGKLTWLLKMAIEIVDFPIKHGDFPVRYVNVDQAR